MNDKSFDQLMRERAQKEPPRLTTEADALFERAMCKARVTQAQTTQTHERKRSWKMWAVVAAECAVALALLLWLPVRDITRQAPNTRQTEHAVRMTPVMHGTVDKGPSVRIDMMYVHQTVTLEGRFENMEDDDIWLIQWNAAVNEPSGMQPQEVWLWLESGAECTYQLSWNGVDAAQAAAQWSYTAYRVTADMLHWIDGVWLRPEEEDYADQQMLMADAMEAQALILEAGEWENGMAGPVRVLLPDAYLDDHPDRQVLEVCVSAGLLEDGSARCSGNSSAECSRLE